MISYSKSSLKNGLRVILSHNEHTRAVTVLVLVKTGSKNEKKRINGVSHFLEHMFFKGTKKRPDKKEMAQLLDEVGAEFNAFTTDDVTGYYIKVERTHIELALDIVSDILQNSTFPPKEIAREKKVIFEEINMISDNPMRQIHQHWQELLYGDQPAGWPVPGTKETVGNISRKDLVEYFTENYLSHNMVVCVSGNFPKKKTRETIAKRFAGVREGDAEPKVPVEEYQTETKVHLVKKQLGQTHVLIGARGYPLSDKRRYALMILADILGGGMSSRLFLSVREEKGLVYYIRTIPESNPDSGFIVTAAGIDNARVGDAIRAIVKEYKSVAKKGVTKKELARAKSSMRGHMYLALEESNEIAEYLAAGELLEGVIRDPEEIMKRIDRITIQEVKDVARDVFRYDKINMVVLGPHKNAKPLKDLLTF